jgi:uncharacterized protein involved in outer membrane biogenesis
MTEPMKVEPMTPGAALAVKEVKRALRWVEYATVILIILMMVLVIIGYADSTNQRDQIRQTAAQSHSALCSFLGDLKGRVETSEEFLQEHPNGIPGLSVEAIRTSLRNQKMTVASLSDLKC